MQYIRTSAAPTPGAYSQGVMVDPLQYTTLYLAGQTANDPNAMDQEVVSGGMVEQTRRCLQNLLAVVTAAGGDATSFVALDVFIKDGPDRAGDSKAYDFAYRQFFDGFGMNPKTGNLPARMQVWVAEIPWESEDTRIGIRGVAAISRNPYAGLPRTHEL